MYIKWTQLNKCTLYSPTLIVNKKIRKTFKKTLRKYKKYFKRTNEIRNAIKIYVKLYLNRMREIFKNRKLLFASAKLS